MPETPTQSATHPEDAGPEPAAARPLDMPATAEEAEPASESTQEPTVPTEEPASVRTPSRADRFLVGLYHQVAGVLGAFGIVALIRDFWDIDLRGIIADITSVWDVTIRPATEWLFHVLLSPLEWIGNEYELDLWMRDYLAIGLVLGLSLLRDFRIRRMAGTRGFSAESFLAGSADIKEQSAGRLRPRHFLLLVALWPLVLAWMLGSWSDDLVGKVKDGATGTEKRSMDAIVGRVGAVTLVIFIVTNVLLFSMVIVQWLFPHLQDTLTPVFIPIALLPFALLMTGSAALISGAIRTDNRVLREAAGSVIRILSPLLYLALLLAFNFWIL